jgi:chaperonin GroES
LACLSYLVGIHPRVIQIADNRASKKWQPLPLVRFVTVSPVQLFLNSPLFSRLVLDTAPAVREDTGPANTPVRDDVPARGCPSPDACDTTGVENNLMKLIPIGDKLVVRRLPAEEITAGGIVLPDSAQAKPLEGRVLAVGDGSLLPDGSRAQPQLSDGDRVIFSSYGGSEVEINGEQLLIMSENDILAVVS